MAIMLPYTHRLYFGGIAKYFFTILHYKYDISVKQG